MAMVYMGGHVSGAHYNPAVSFAVFLRRKMGATELVSYWAVQLLGAALAFSFGYLVSGHTPGIHPGAKVGTLSALAVEVAFTLALVTVVFNSAATRATQGNSFYGLAIGITIVAAAFAGGPISGGAFNPAVGFGATLGSALFGGGSWSDLWLYFAGPLLGAAIGAGVHWLQIKGSEMAFEPPEGTSSPGAPQPVPESPETT
jgi:aquaporin Z